MNATQIDHLLDLIEQKDTRAAAQQEAISYIRLNMAKVAKDLETSGVAVISTAFGPVEVTASEAGLIAA